MKWKGLMVVTGSESPIVVVLSGSMELAFQRGTLLFLTNYEEEEIRVGEIVVFKPSSNILAAGTAAQQLDTSYSTNSNLEIYGRIIHTPLMFLPFSLGLNFIRIRA